MSGAPSSAPSSARPAVLLASQNAGKAREFTALLQGLVVVEALTPEDAAHMPEETGETFEENARLKVEAIARRTGRVVLADDSGLVVDALDGAPGVRSARYAPGTDRDRYEKLLAALAHLDPADRAARAARFVCALAYAHPGRPLVLVRGTLEGHIIAEARGAHGFGYDPVFVPEGGARTLAEHDLAEKGLLSHRGRALARLRPLLAHDLGLGA